MNKRIERIKLKALPILKRYNVVRAGIFGSYARGDNKKNSDIDILIEVKGRKFSLFDLVGLKIDLENKLKTKVDVLTYKSIYPPLKETILSEEVKIL